MKKSLVLAMAMALGVSATAFAANPFSDVPAGHWAYASVAKLAAAGIVDGYPDGTFKGDCLMTRYEMAQIVAKAYAKGAIGADDKLMAEFADELDNLGVRVAKLEKKSDNVKMTGQARFGYKDIESRSYYKYKFNESELRTRLYLSGEINKDWTYGAMIQNSQYLNTNKEDSDTKFRRAFVKGDLNGVTITAGRQAFTIGQGYVADLSGDALKVDFGNKLKTSAFAGRFDSVMYGDWFDGYSDGQNDKATIYGVVANYPFNDKLHTEIGFYAREGNDNLPAEQKIYTAGLGYKFDENVSLYGEYQKADKNLAEVRGWFNTWDYGDDGWAATLTYKGAKASDKGSWGTYVTYYDQAGAVILDSVSEIEDYFFYHYGMKGYEVGVDYVLAKNILANVSYYDVDYKDESGSDDGAKMLWTNVTFNF